MPIRDPARLTETILEALAKSGLRGILSAGWGGLPDKGLPDTVMRIGYTPYPWLFPRMAGVVHHGGSGTTGLALASGVPSMIVPFLADQYWKAHHRAWSQFDPHRLSAEPLSARMVGTRPQRALGEKIRLEKGIENAVQIIQRVMNRTNCLKIRLARECRDAAALRPYEKYAEYSDSF
jgi:sterol 3beta-glucosyltransferase